MFDILIRNAQIADGTGNPMYSGSIGISNEKILYIGPDANYDAHTIIEAAGQLVASPGFIDTHCHEDFYLFHDSTVFPKLQQGVTSIINGNCGCSAAPVRKTTFSMLKTYFNSSLHGISMPADWDSYCDFRDYMNAVDALDPGINTGFMVGHGTIRIAAMGFENRHADKIEMAAMMKMIAEAMESGALGLTSGLFYAPGVFASKDELLELCSIVSYFNGVYATHMRDEGKYLLESVRESIDIAKKTGVRLLISHLKVSGFKNRPLLEPVLALIEEAKAEGVEIAMDQYPYNSGSTGLDALLPPEYLDGGINEMMLKIANIKDRNKIKSKILDQDSDWENIILDSGFNKIVILSAENSEGASGNTIQDYADSIGMDPMDAFFSILIKSGGHARCAMYYSENECVEKIFRHPLTMIGSDSDFLGEPLLVHPRGFGAYPKILGEYVRQKKILPLEQAIRKMTGMPADFFNIARKGYLKTGYDSDLVLFDPDSITDTATFLNPWNPCQGIKSVIVNGHIAINDSKLQDMKSGQIIKGAARTF